MSGAGVTPTIGVCEDDDELRGDPARGAASARAERPRHRLRGRGGAVFARRRRPTSSCSTSACPTPTGATSARRCARGASRPGAVPDREAHGLPDRLSGFHAGGDDYLTKPFALAELLVRVHALLRRAAAPAARRRPSASSWTRRRHAIVHGGSAVPLTPTEFRLLAALAARRGRGRAPRRRSSRPAWPDGAIVHDNTLDAYLARIRRKLRSADAPARDRHGARRRLRAAMTFRRRLLAASLLTLAVGLGALLVVGNVLLARRVARPRRSSAAARPRRRRSSPR